MKNKINKIAISQTDGTTKCYVDINDFKREIKSRDSKIKNLELKLEKKKYKVGDEVKWCNFDWIVIKTGTKLQNITIDLPGFMVTEEKDYFDIVYPNEIIGKPSYNIIDLIEIGDYANGQKVNKIIVDKDISNNDKLKFGDDDLVLTFKSNHDTYYLYVEDIESIVTKEQFESMKYEV